MIMLGIAEKGIEGVLGEILVLNSVSSIFVGRFMVMAPFFFASQFP